MSKVHRWGDLVPVRFNPATARLEYLGNPPPTPVAWPDTNPSMLLAPTWAEELRNMRTRSTS